MTQPPSGNTSSLLELQAQLGTKWSNLVNAKSLAAATRSELRQALIGKDSDDPSIVVFGSLARDEFTRGSDIDWTLLIEGVADTHHLDLVQEILVVMAQRARAPGPEAIFGSMAWSHPLVHLIGGEDDTNRNTTQRILMLLESSPLGRREAYDRVCIDILNRYIVEDPDSLKKEPRTTSRDFC